MHWLVMTPEYWYVEPILDDGSGPIEYGADMCYVEARTKREAIVAGVKKMRSNEWYRKYGRQFTYYGWFWDESTNPFTGVKAEKSMCPHGFCHCEDLPCDNKPGNGDYCETCYDESMRESANSCEHQMSANGDWCVGKCGLMKDDIEKYETR